MSDILGKCKTCEHWCRTSDDRWDGIANPYDPDTMDYAVMPFEVRQCTSPNIVYFERNPNSNGISLKDGSDYRAVMYTGEDFGCVLYEEAKE
jgi:hypothetical protein